MDSALLKQFRQQLSTWIETRLATQRLPFQRLEICPRTLTDQGRLVPDLVLWVNRDSQLAGSMVLLPDIVDEKTLNDGRAMARALGLGHFTTWAARKVSIWEVTADATEQLTSFPLPPANRITPEDFEQTLDELLEQLKIVSVTSAPSAEQYTAHYFANLCLRNLQDLAPGLTISSRVAAGQTAADDWLEQAPLEKAWMSLWRILFLLWQKRLPPGLQPERLDLAIHYALADMDSNQLTELDIRDKEPPLPEEDAVRLHHLASRLRQLGWPHDTNQAETLIKLLLHEVAHRYNLGTPQLPWDIDEVDLRVFCQVPHSATHFSLVAPRAYLAGWAFISLLLKQGQGNVYTESLRSLESLQGLSRALAVFNETLPPSREDCAARLILLRQAWPSRRFDLPRKTPAWLWDVLHLAGLISEELTLVLPLNWHCVPGITNLWTILTERYQLVDLCEHPPEHQALHFVRTKQCPKPIHLYINGQRFAVETPLSKSIKPGTTQLYLNAEASIIELMQNREMALLESEEQEVSSWGAYLFLHTKFGRYLWESCSDNAILPTYDQTKTSIIKYGIPMPKEIVLADLSLIGDKDTQTIPERTLLDREFASIFGPTPNLPEIVCHVAQEPPRTRHRSTPTEEITAKIFCDGIPRFPEHYLMNVYRPELVRYNFNGPLEITEEFFDRISLRSKNNDHVIEVSGKTVAEALILASQANKTGASLPKDEIILRELVEAYKADLEQIWDSLVRECRRLEPHRQAAIKLARKIWRQQGLPDKTATE